MGVVAVVTAAIVAIGGVSAPYAVATPAAPRSDVLGVGDTVADLDISEKLPVGAAEIPQSMTTAQVRAKAPVPKPKPKPAARHIAKPAARASTPAAPASSRASDTGGWQSARVSWYGPGFYGRRTASGAVLVQGMMNVAHKSLPFGTRIQFEYKGRTATAVVNDRGPYVGGRTFDLGPGTAQALGFGGVGTVHYRILGR
jgi:rare lipoprotein A (peptidoglycan hydrolase)